MAVKKVKKSLFGQILRKSTNRIKKIYLNFTFYPQAGVVRRNQVPGTLNRQILFYNLHFIKKGTVPRGLNGIALHDFLRYLNRH